MDTQETPKKITPATKSDETRLRKDNESYELARDGYWRQKYLVKLEDENASLKRRVKELQARVYESEEKIQALLGFKKDRPEYWETIFNRPPKTAEDGPKPILRKTAPATTRETKERPDQWSRNWVPAVRKYFESLKADAFEGLNRCSIRHRALNTLQPLSHECDYVADIIDEWLEKHLPDRQ